MDIMYNDLNVRIINGHLDPGGDGLAPQERFLRQGNFEADFAAGKSQGLHPGLDTISLGRIDGQLKRANPHTEPLRPREGASRKATTRATPPPRGEGRTRSRQFETYDRRSARTRGEGGPPRAPGRRMARGRKVCKGVVVAAAAAEAAVRS